MTQSATPGIPWRSYSRPGFQSCKTTRPVFYSGRWPRDALVQATLDPSIRLITPAYLPEAPEDAELALDVTRGATRELHAYCRNSHGPLSAPEGYDCAVAIPRFKVMQPSVLLVARMIWKMRSYPVDAETALTIRRLLLANAGNCQKQP